MTDHIGRVGYVPAYRLYNITCIKCGECLTTDYNGIFLQEYQTGVEMDWPGDCNPGNILGVHVADNVKSGDYFGGKKRNG